MRNQHITALVVLCTIVLVALVLITAYNHDRINKLVGESWYMSLTSHHHYPKAGEETVIKLNENRGRQARQ